MPALAEEARDLARVVALEAEGDRRAALRRPGRVGDAAHPDAGHAPTPLDEPPHEPDS